ncbi:MAG TPA: ATP:cob(I)alamin adenosyltransferase, partial [Ignavibacteriaceae bacterium]
MKIYTKTGDKGETGLFGGERISKDSPRISAYGTIDELNSFIGYAITDINDVSVKENLIKIQNYLFTVGSDLATPNNEKNTKLKIERTPESFFLEIEKMIDHYDSQLEELKNFI